MGLFSDNRIKQVVSQLIKTPEVFTGFLYFLSFILVLTPFYNWFYRVTVNLLHLFALWGALLVIFIGIMPGYLFKLAFKRVLYTVVAGLLIFFAGRYVQSWRYHLTDYYIQGAYCGVNSIRSDDVILGGIKRLQIHEVETTHTFVNNSHCLSVVCSEEFYVCG